MLRWNDVMLEDGLDGMMSCLDGMERCHVEME